MRGKGRLLPSAAVLASIAFASAAQAQRANENATTTADDAFGTRVGNEGVGLYDMNNARGFNPQLAGNVRVEGLYIDIQGLFGARLTKSTTMHIGLAAQSYPFPAPTGIADISIQQPTDHTVTSVQLQYSTPFGMSPMSIDVATPLIGDKLGMVAGFNNMMVRGDAHSSGRIMTEAVMFRWRPADNFEIMPIFYDNHAFNFDTAPSVFLAGAALPPQYDRNTFFGEPWASQRHNEQNYGVIARGTFWTNWRLQGDFFHTQQKRLKNDVVFFRNTQANGSANMDILRYPEHFSGSYSGEVRASGVFTDGSYRHTIHLGARARDVLRRFGGSNTISFGAATVGVYTPRAEPTFNFGVLDVDRVKQVTPGASYVGQWAGVGEFSVGLQKSFYHRDYGKLGATPTTTTAHPWLYNGTLAVTPIKDLTIYAGYTRGLEEFGTAPDNALNGGEPLPAKVTKQIDGGIRYRLIPGLNLMAGFFQVSKPLFDRNTVNVYTTVGSLRHRGIEMSLTGKPLPNLTVVAGAVLLQARASGLPVDLGLIGRVSPGTLPSIYRLSVQYDIPQIRGLFVDTQIESNGSYYANRLNTLRVGSAQTLALGARYSFTVLGVSSSLRGQVLNVTNAYDWVVDNASGRISPTQPRRYVIRLSADF